MAQETSPEKSGKRSVSLLCRCRRPQGDRLLHVVGRNDRAIGRSAKHAAANATLASRPASWPDGRRSTAAQSRRWAGIAAGRPTPFTCRLRRGGRLRRSRSCSLGTGTPVLSFPRLRRVAAACDDADDDAGDYSRDRARKIRCQPQGTQSVVFGTGCAGGPHSLACAAGLDRERAWMPPLP